MILRVGERHRAGRAVTCRADVSPTRLAAAVRRDSALDGEPPLQVLGRTPGPVHDHVGCVHPGMGLKVRTALAKAGRARGLRTPLDPEIADLRRRIDAIDAPEADDARAERRAVARAGAETDRLAEQVAEERGRLAARREAGADGTASEDGESALERAVGDLAAVETEAVAARQDHDRKRAALRSTRDRLADRMSLEDDLANARREARAWLVGQLQDAFEAALRGLPGPETSPGADPFDVPPVPAALAIARVARPAAPVVVATERFADAEAAAAWLAAPVLRLGV